MFSKLRVLFCCFWALMLLTANSTYASVAGNITTLGATDRIIRGEFKQTQYLLNVDKPFESSGNFIFWRNRAMLWRTIQPVRTSTIFTNQKLSTFLFINGKRIKTNASPTTSMINRILWNIAAGSLDVLALDFQVLSQFDSTGWEFTLLPDSSVTNLIAKRISVRGTSFAEEITVEYFSGDITVLELTNITFDSTTSSLEEAELDNP